MYDSPCPTYDLRYRSAWRADRPAGSSAKAHRDAYHHHLNRRAALTLASLDRLNTITPARARLLRERLAASGFEARVPHEIESASIIGAFEELRLPLVDRALRRDGTPAATLALLFQYAGVVPADLVEDAIGADGLAWLLEGGLVEQAGRQCRSGVRLQVAEGAWIFCDDPSGGGQAVMRPGPTTVDLLAALPPLHGSRLLDVGSGPGTIALVAAMQGAALSVGTDIAPRAITLARFNAMFNDLPVDVREGDLLEPVRDERFSIIAAQPPYVAQPSEQQAVAFLHGGPMGDEIAMRLLQGIPDRLLPSGMAVVLFDSPVRHGAPIHDRVRDAVGEAGIDVAVFNSPSVPPDLQAIGYAALHEPGFGEAYARTAVRYRDHLEARGVNEVTHSLVVLRKRADPAAQGWTFGMPVPFAAEWREIGPFLEGLDLIVGTDDELASARVRPHDAAILVRERRPTAATADERRSVRLDGPSMVSARELTPAAAVLFELFANTPSVTATSARFATAMDQPMEEVRPLVLTFVRENLGRGLLIPA
jgi:SAM-dependent methyltransferase